MLIDDINNDLDLKKLNIEELKVLAFEIRKFLVSTVSETGGHLASNLGVVELTLALHYIFDIDNNDSVVWDVGHQSYVHKILTGRKDEFNSLRKFNGLSGFPKVDEDKRDTFNTGHSSTSVSAASGIAKAKELLGETGKTIAVIGDGAMTGGMALEGLNYAGQNTKNFIVILNDNDMSISKNVGGISKALKRLRNANRYLKLKNDVKSALDNIPVVGVPTKKGLTRVKSDIKKIVVNGDSLFESIGFNYLGPIDGHDFDELFRILNHAKTLVEPIFIHVHTKKGKGYSPAEENPGLFHGIGKFNPKTGRVVETSNRETWSKVFGDSICSIARENSNVVAVTAAMPDGTGLSNFSKIYRDRFFDVGIAEQHAVTFSAGLASRGLIPIFAVYSTFLQRGYDQILHDTALQNLHVIFAVDRSGPVGRDGETHQGTYDISYLSHMPNLKIFSPVIASDLPTMLEYAVNCCKCPIVIRYPRGSVLLSDDFDSKIIPLEKENCEKARVILKTNFNTDIAIISVGVMAKNAYLAAKILHNKGYRVTVIDSVCIKPIDKKTIKKECDKVKLVATVENNVEIGGFGSMIKSILDKPVTIFAYDDEPIVQGSIDELEEKYGLTPEFIAEKIESVYNDINE